MRLEDFSARIQSHGDFRAHGVRYSDRAADDRLVVERRRDGALLAVPVRVIAAADWASLETVLRGDTPHAAIGPDAPEGAIACGWTRSVIGVVKDRHVRAYSVETLIAR